MTVLWLLGGLTVAAALAHGAVVTRRVGLFTLDGIFVIAQSVMALGALTLLDADLPGDVTYGVVVCAPVWIYTLVSSVTHIVTTRDRPSRGPRQTPLRPRAAIHALVSSVTHIVTSPGRAVRGPKEIPYRPTPAVYALLGVSIAVMIAYYYAVGYSTFLIALRQIFTSDTPADIATLRLNSYSSGGYFYPGYANQFKNVLLPSLSVIVSLHFIRNRLPYRRTLTVALAALSTFGLLGTGQRGAFASFAVALLIFMSLMTRQLSWKRTLGVGLAAVGVLGLSTLALGRRAGEVEGASGPLGSAWVILDELFDRIFQSNQFSGVAAWRYTQGMEGPFLAQWGENLLALLPGPSTGTLIENEVYASLYGTSRGTAPLSLWGSVYFNLGLGGTLLVAALLGFAFQRWTVATMSGREMNTLAIMATAGCFATLGTWIAGGPDALINSGLVSYAALLAVARFTGTRKVGHDRISATGLDPHAVSQRRATHRGDARLPRLPDLRQLGGRVRRRRLR